MFAQILIVVLGCAGLCYALLVAPRQVKERRDSAIRPFQDLSDSEIEQAAKYSLQVAIGTAPEAKNLRRPGSQTLKNELAAALIFLHRKKKGDDGLALQAHWARTIANLQSVTKRSRLQNTDLKKLEEAFFDQSSIIHCGQEVCADVKTRVVKSLLPTETSAS